MSLKCSACPLIPCLCLALLAAIAGLSYCCGEVDVVLYKEVISRSEDLYLVG